MNSNELFHAYLRRTGIIVGLCLLCVSNGDAQIAITNTFLPSSNIVKIDPPPGESAKLGMNIFDMAVGVPLYVKVDEEAGSFTELTNTVGFRLHSFDLTLPAGQDEYFPKRLYAVNNSLTLFKSLKGPWLMVVFASVGIASDFRNITGDHILAEGGGFLVRRFGKNLLLGIGPVFTYAFGDPVLVPAPFVRLMGEGRFSFEVQFPKRAFVGYKITDNIQIGTEAKSLYNNYSLGHKKAEDADGKSTVVVFSDIALSLQGAVRVYKPLFLNLGVGTTVNRQFKVDDHSGHKLFDRKMEKNIFFSAALETRM